MEPIMSFLIPALRTTAERWKGLAAAFPGERLSLPAAAGEWSAIECLQHIIDTEKLFGFRLQAFLDGRDFPAFNPDADGTQGNAASAAQLAEEFARLRNENLDALSKISADDLPRKARHAELGMVSLEEMLNEWLGHDLNHTIQAERALLQPLIRQCGPWKKYFLDQIVGEA